MRTRVGRRLTYAGLAALMLATTAFALAACGSVGGSNSAATVETYTDATYGYSFQYTPAWKLQQGDSAAVTAGATAKGNIGVYNPKGSNSKGNYYDLAEVSVYELAKTVDESMMPDVKVEVQRVFDQLASQSGDWKALDSLADTTVGGLKGWTISYSFNTDAGASTCRFYVVFGGNLEYQLLVQSSTKDWEADQPVFDGIVHSFKPGNATATTATTAATTSTSTSTSQ